MCYNFYGENMKKRIKDILIGILSIICYFGLSLISNLPFKIAGVDINQVPNIIKSIYLIIYELLVTAIILLIFNKKIKKDLKDILINHKEYYSKYIKYYLIGLSVMLISNCIIIYGFNIEMSNNEETIRALFKNSPIYIYMASVIFAPIIEELVFRQGIKNIIGRNYLFIITSGLVFGGMHVITSMTSYIDLLYIIPYSALGISFAYMLYKTDNIFVSMGFHFMHNGILMALQCLILIFS